MAPLEYTLTTTAPCGSRTKPVHCRYSGSALTNAPVRMLRLTVRRFVGSPLPVDTDELTAHARRQVIRRDASRQYDHRTHLGQVLGTVRAACHVGFEAVPLRTGQGALEIAGDQFDRLLTGQAAPGP